MNDIRRHMRLPALTIALAACSALHAQTDPPPCGTALQTTRPTCPDEADGSLTVTGGNGGPYTYVWFHDPMVTSATATGLPAGFYNVLVMNEEVGAECADLLEIELTNPDVPPLGTMTTTNISCPGANDGSVRFTITPGPYTWQWIDDPNQTNPALTGLGPGAYTVLVSGGACPSWVSGFLGDPAITILGDAAYCATEPPLLTTDPLWGFTPDEYVWSTGETTSSIQIEAGTEGPIQLTATNTALGCVLSAEINLIQRVGPTVAFSAPDTLCERVAGVAVTTSDAAVLRWVWGTGDTSSLSQPSVSFDEPYWQPISLQGFDIDGCGGEPARDSVYVRPRLEADFMAAQVPCSSLLDLRFNSYSDSCAFFIGDSLMLDMCHGAIRLDMHRYQIYDLTFYSTQPNRCDDTSMVSIDMIAEPILFLPNAFTPDGDLINDEWPGPVAIPEEGYELQVFDRWGHSHWRSTDIHERWTGASLPAGVYVYTMRMRDPCEPTKEVARKGTVSLIR